MYLCMYVPTYVELYAAAQASIMRMRGGRGASGGARTLRGKARAGRARWARVGRAVRSQKQYVGARRARCVRKKYFFSFEFVQVRAFAGARGENIFLVEAFSRAFWRTDGRTDGGGRYSQAYASPIYGPTVLVFFSRDAILAQLDISGP